MVGNHYIQSSNQEGNVELIKLWEQERKERVAISIRSQEEMESVVSRIDMKPGVVVLKKTND